MIEDARLKTDSGSPTMQPDILIAGFRGRNRPTGQGAGPRDDSGPAPSSWPDSLGRTPDEKDSVSPVEDAMKLGLWEPMINHGVGMD